MNRRVFLKSGAMAMLSLGFAPSFLGRAAAAVRFGVASGRVSTIDVFADPERLRGLVPVRPKG